MAEIKFRAWHKELNEMYDWGELQVKGKWWTYPEYKLMQFTGLHDKNGKEIYEGDIVKNLRYGNLAEVVFKHSDFCKGMTEVRDPLFGGTDNLEGFFHELSYFGLKMLGGENKAFYIQDTEIIGNIYENQELLTT